MAEAMPLPLFWEWQAYRRLSPFEGERGDWRAGMVAATMANIWRKRGADSLRPGDFMPQWDRYEGRDSPQTLFKKIRAGLGFYGLKKKKKNGDT